MKRKICTKCGESKLLTEYYKHPGFKDGRDAKCRDCVLKARKGFYKKWYDKRRKEALLRFSGGDVKCACCGETRIEFMAIDHVKGGGNQHRKKTGGDHYYSQLLKAPVDEYRVLCHNCNFSFGKYGYCPHQSRV